MSIFFKQIYDFFGFQMYSYLQAADKIIKFYRNIDFLFIFFYIHKKKIRGTKGEDMEDRRKSEEHRRKNHGERRKNQDDIKNVENERRTGKPERRMNNEDRRKEK